MKTGIFLVGEEIGERLAGKSKKVKFCVVEALHGTKRDRSFKSLVQMGCQSMLEAYRNGTHLW